MKDKSKKSKHSVMIFYRKYILFFAFIIMLLASCNKKDEKADEHQDHSNHNIKKVDSLRSDKSKVEYYCPMDTQIVMEKPGSCPICGMDLEPRPLSGKSGIEKGEDLVFNPANVNVLSTVKAIKPVQKSVPIEISAGGYITYDTRRLYNISSRIGGRIERLYAKYKFQPISKGEKLFDIYSHELLTSQQEYLYLVKEDPTADDLIKAARKKLLLLGMTERQINNLNESHHVHPTTTVFSPYSGFLIEKKEADQIAQSGASGGMIEDQNMSQPTIMPNSSEEILLREGSYVNRGQSVLSVANTEVVWAILEVYSTDLSIIKSNQPVEIKLENIDKTISGKINFIEPVYKDGSGTARLRIYLNNKDQSLKIGNLISGKIHAGSNVGLWIPKTAVYDLGIDKIVFVKTDGGYQTRKVEVGYSSDSEIQIVSGLKKDEEIAENSQFMIDSESFVKVGNQ